MAKQTNEYVIIASRCKMITCNVKSNALMHIWYTAHINAREKNYFIRIFSMRALPVGYWILAVTVYLNFITILDNM